MNPPCVTEGLRDLMTNLTKEILGRKPLNIYEFSANYFESVIKEKKVLKHRSFEAILSYETIIKNSTVSQVRLSLLYGIIPKELIELIKEFVKAVLRTNPENICEFAVQYFNNLKEKFCSTNRLVEYSSYENYLESTQGFSTNAVEKCTCGRVLTQRYKNETIYSYLDASKGSTDISHLDLSISNKINNQQLKTLKLTTENNTQNLCESERNQHQKYMPAIVIIQRFLRRILKNRKLEANIKKDRIIKEVGEPPNNEVSTEVIRQLNKTPHEYMTVNDTTPEMVAKVHTEKSRTNIDSFRNTNLPRTSEGICVFTLNLITLNLKYSL